MSSSPAGALKQKPAERYSTVAAFADDLQRWLRHEPVSAGPDSLGYRARKLVRRHRIAAISGVVVLLVAGTWLTMLLADRARVRRALEDARASTRKAEQVTEFALGMFDNGGAGANSGDSVIARDVLARGVKRAHELSAQPATEAQMLDLIGRIYMQMGDYAGARPLLQEALDIRRRALGEDHADVATSLMHLASLIGEEGRQSAQAIPLLQRALAIRIRLFGHADPLATDALYQLASEMHMAGRYADAKPMFERWLKNIRRQPRQLTPERARQLAMMSNIMQYSRQTERADTLQREVLAIDRALYGNAHVRVAVDLSELGRLRLEIGDTVSADTLLRQSVRLLRATYPEGHPLLAASLRNLGYMLVERDQWPEAETVWQESAATFLKYKGNRSADYLNAAAFLGLSEAMRGRSTEAERLLRIVLASDLAARPEPNPIADRARLFLGRALLDQGRVTEAEPLLLGAATTKGRTLSRASHRLAVRSLVELYRAEGRPLDTARIAAGARRP